MKVSDLEKCVEALIPKLYSFSYILLPQREAAMSLITDAYASFITREKEFIAQLKISNSADQIKVKKFILHHLIMDIYQLAVHRLVDSQYLFSRSLVEFDVFYKLRMKDRAILFLKEKLGMKTEKIQKIFGLKKYQVLEVLHNARFLILKYDREDLSYAKESYGV